MDTNRFTLVDGLLLLVVLAWAAGTRAAYLQLCADNGTTSGPLAVQASSPVLAGLPADTPVRGQAPPREVDVLIQNLAEHRWFGSLAPFAAAEEQAAHTAPGYPWLVSLLERGHVNLGPTDRVVRWAQCLLGTLTAVFYFLFARIAFGNPLVALLAGLACALHPYWIINTAEVDDGVLASFLLAACVFLGARAGQGGGPFTSLLYGLALAGLALVRAALLPFAFVAMLWFLFHCRSLLHGWRAGLLAFLGLAIGLTPWTLRNYQVFGDVLPITNSVFYELWAGNNPQATGGPLDEQTLLTALAEARGEEPATTAEHLAGLKQGPRYNELAWDIVREVQTNPGGTLQRRLWAGLYFVFGGRWFTDHALAATTPTAEADMPPWLAQTYAGLLAGWLLALLTLGFLGWRWTYAWRREAMPSSLAVIWVPLPYLLGHAGTLAGPRLPLDGVLLTYAAFALVCLIPGVGATLLRGPQAAGERMRKQP